MLWTCRYIAKFFHCYFGGKYPDLSTHRFQKSVLFVDLLVTVKEGEIPENSESVMFYNEGPETLWWKLKVTQQPAVDPDMKHHTPNL